MKTFTCRYPGDPESVVVEMTRAEFVANYRPGNCIINGSVVFALGPDEIICDACNDDITDPVYMIDDAYAWCAKCFRENSEAYCTPAEVET